MGMKLIQTVLDKAQKLGCYRLFVETAYQWKAAHQLYEKMGFTNYGYHFIKNLNR
jgi:GNAT superfamily N-acetyltransferase